MLPGSKLKQMLFRVALLCFVALNVDAATPPLINYVTYLGGSYADTAAGIAVDSTGAAYVAGNTSSPDFPVTSTSLGAPSATSNCAFVTKLNPSGTAIDFSICLANSRTTAFALDTNGNIYLGTGNSVVKLDPAAQNILYTVQTGGSVESLAADAAGDVYIAGTGGPGLATTSGAYQSQSAGGVSCPNALNGPEVQCNNAFITKLSPSGSVAWSTYLGGSGPDDAHAIAVDSAGNVWVAGETLSPNFPTTAGAISRTFQGEINLGPLRYGDAFVAKLDPSGSHLLYSTYLGGSGPDGAFSLAVDAAGAVYIAGGTGSPNFPTTAGALQTTYTGYDPNIPPDLGPDGFVTKLDASGDLIYSTLTPSANPSIVADASGQLYVGWSGDATSSTIQPTCATPPTAAVSVINSAGSAVVASSPIPGAYLALDGKGGLYSSGLAQTLVFFSTPHAFQTEYGGGGSDAFAAKVDFSQPAGPSIASVLNAASLFPGFATNFPTGAVAPGEIVTLFGNGFGWAKPTVNFGQFPAPVLYSSNCQINAVVPFEANQLPTTLVTVQLGGENSGQTLGPIKLPVVVAAPGIFTTNGSGSGQAAVLNQDSSVNSSSNPAARGSIVSVYLTGTGALNPAIADGSLGPTTAPFPAPVASISATIYGEDLPITSAGQAPGLIAGATQVNIQIPQYVPYGAAVPVIIYAGGYASTYTKTVTLAIR
jgi:uncharacterized protein (TIGR03437 family)